MIKIGSALMEHAEQLERERGIPRDVTVDALKEAMVAAYKKYAKLNSSVGYECILNERSGEIGVFLVQTVVNEISEELIEEGTEYSQILLEDARKIKADAEIGETIETEVTPDDFGRIAAQSAKQVITQRIREAEKYLVLKEYEDKKGRVTTGIVQRIEGRNVVVNIGKTEAILPPREQLPGEYYRVGNKLRVYVADLRDSGRVPQIIVSQGHAEMVREVFELEVPEIEDGIIEIKSIAREAGFRTKVAVSSNDPDVDPQGACIGTRGSRIQAVVNELKNEKIDIIRWSEDPIEFILNALAPAKILNVYLDYSQEGVNKALVIVPDDQLSLSIGREGQNVRLAAKLTHYRLDIKPLSVIEQEGLPLHIYQQYYGDPDAVEAETAEGEEGTTEATVEVGEETTATETETTNEVSPETTETADVEETESKAESAEDEATLADAEEDEETITSDEEKEEVLS